jgi:hypothetical protein
LRTTGFGEVYKARDTRIDRTVAIKILPSADPELKARLEREAKAPSNSLILRGQKQPVNNVTVDNATVAVI